MKNHDVKNHFHQTEGIDGHLPITVLRSMYILYKTPDAKPELAYPSL
jgi:hypothetical protein